MPNLKTLKQRINSVKATKKITSAMKMVATSSLRRYQEKLANVIPFAQGVENDVKALKDFLSLKEAIPSIIKGRTPHKSHLLLIFSADRGLCGNYNMRLFQFVLRKINALQKEGIATHIVCLGHKVASLLNLLSHTQPTKIFTLNYKALYASLLPVAYYLTFLFKEGKIDSCSTYFMKFVSALVSNPISYDLIPFSPQHPYENKDSTPVSPRCLFGVEPDAHTFLPNAAFFNIITQLQFAAIEGKASEESARMVARDNATRNAEDMIDKLELLYNRTRQAYITKELIEIISCAEAL